MKLNNSIQKESKQPLTIYLREISQIPLLTREEEHQLGLQAQTGNQEAMQKLVESNLRFVVKVAKRYARFGYSLQDLINEGNLGLMEAARRFDPNRGVKFISYAIWWIRQSILTALSNFGHPMRIPAKVNRSLLKIRASISAIENSELGERANLNEIAKEFGITEKQLISTLLAGGTGVSLQQPLYAGSDTSIGESIEQSSVRSAESDVMDESVRQTLQEILNGLRENEQKVLRMRFGLDQETGLTLKEIGRQMGVSRERIRQIETQALAKLRSKSEVRAMKSVLSENLQAL